MKKQIFGQIKVQIDQNDSTVIGTWNLFEGENIIGNDLSKCDIILKFPEISSTHLKLTLYDDDYTIEDLDSEHGTFKINNDEKIKLRPHRVYDVFEHQNLYISNYMFYFVKNQDKDDNQKEQENNVIEQKDEEKYQEDDYQTSLLVKTNQVEIQKQKIQHPLTKTSKIKDSKSNKNFVQQISQKYQSDSYDEFDNTQNQKKNDEQKKKQNKKFAKKIKQIKNAKQSQTYTSDDEQLEEEAVRPRKKDMKRDQLRVLISNYKMTNMQIREFKNLGGIIVEKEQKFNILVQNGDIRSIKLLLAISKGIQVVTLDWFLDSLKSKKLQDQDKYIYECPELQNKYNFNLQNSIKMAKEQFGLFEDKTFFMPDNIIPVYDDIQLLIESCKGTVVSKRQIDQDTIIISDNIETVQNYFSGEKCIYSPEFIFSSILKCQIDLNQHILQEENK